MYSLHQLSQTVLRPEQSWSSPPDQVRVVPQCQAFRPTDPQIRQCQNAAIKSGRYCHNHWDYDPEIERYLPLATRAGVSLDAAMRVVTTMMDGINQ